MTTSRIRLIALDVDGTLVGADSTISPRVREAIANAKARGAETTIVPGRSHRRSASRARS
jgi:hydroxymethylpyrimidine pyrophosphatase-like HAD family hydrolase